MLQDETLLLSNKLENMAVELGSAKTYIHNLSTILRDMQNAVLLAKYGSGSTKAVLAELIQSMELSLNNVQYLPPPSYLSESLDWSRPMAAPNVNSFDHRLTYPPTENPFTGETENGPANNYDPGNYDPVEDVSDF
jgi:hypothetical protein